MKLKTLTNNDISVIRCRGNMATKKAAKVLQNAINNLPKPTNVIINLNKIGEIGHDAIVVMNNAVANGYDIILTELQPAVENVVSISKVNKTISIYTQEEIAISNIRYLQTAAK